MRRRKEASTEDICLEDLRGGFDEIRSSGLLLGLRGQGIGVTAIFGVSRRSPVSWAGGSEAFFKLNYFRIF